MQGWPKVGIQYIVNYCIPTIYLLLAHPVFTHRDVRQVLRFGHRSFLRNIKICLNLFVP